MTRTVQNYLPKDGSIVSVVLLLITFLIANEALMHACRLGAERFRDPVLMVAYFDRGLLTGTLLVVAVVALTVTGFVPGHIRWKDLKHGNPSRIAVVACALSLAWPFATYDYNLYLDQGHYVDRFALVVLFVLVCWRPAFVFPFLIVLLPLIAQRDVPLGVFTWTTHLLPIRILVLFSSMFVYGVLLRRWYVSSFVFVVFIFLAAHYVAPAVAKLSNGWLFEEHFELLIPARFATGWNGIVNEDSIGSITRFVGTLNIPVKIFVVTLEFGGVLILAVNRRVSMLLLACWAFFHFAVFALSGVCFWQWSLINTSLFFVLWRYPDLIDWSKFTVLHRLGSIALIATGIVWLAAPPLFWLDTPLIYTYRIEGKGESGARYNLPTSMFGPYHFEMKLQGFAHLESERPLLGRVWGGVQDRHEAAAADLVNTAEQAFANEREFGDVRYRNDRSDRTREFLKTYVENLNERGSSDSLLSFVKSPPVLWITPRDRDYQFEEPIREVRVFHVFSLWDGERIQVIREKEMLHVPIAQ